MRPREASTPTGRRWSALVGILVLLVGVFVVHALFPDTIGKYTRSTLDSLRRWSANAVDR